MAALDHVTLTTVLALDEPKVRVTGRHALPHTGSGHYSTSLLLGVDAITVRAP